MSLRPVVQPPGSPALAAFVVGFAARAGEIALRPENYSFDAYQRWAGRDHLLVQGWLPATQSVLWGVGELGGGMLATQLVLSALAAGAAAAATVVAGHFGGRTAAWAAVALGLFGPALAWTRVPYQEGVFLLCVLGGVALATRGRFFLGDLVFGAAGLVRYEGWVFLAAWLAYRGTPRAVIALWGPAAWAVVYGALGMRGHTASPIDYDDWKHLGEGVSVQVWAERVFDFCQQAWHTGGVLLCVGALWGIVCALRRARRGASLLLALVVVQLGVTVAWIAALDAATLRMQVIPAYLLVPFAAAAAADLWDDLPDRRVRGLVAGLLALFALAGLEEADGEARGALGYVSPERAAAAEILALPGRTWWIEPRGELGTRARHDGCEVIQGTLEDFRHGRDFWCGPWVPVEDGPALQAGTTGLVRWTGREYEVHPEWPDARPKPRRITVKSSHP